MKRRFSTDQIASPADLAATVDRFLSRSPFKYDVSLESLKTIFETLFYLSLETEEGEHIRCSVTYHSPKTSGGKGRTQFSPLKFSLETLSKIALSVDPDQASLGLYPDTKGHLTIWGILDQFPLHMRRSLHWESSRWERSPGLFHAVITAPGEITVFIRDQVLAVLRHGRLITENPDVLWNGTINSKLRSYIEPYLRAVRAEVGEELYKSWGEWYIGTDEEKFYANRDWSERTAMSWAGALCRILLTIQRYRHGGAILLLPTGKPRGLNVKYRFKYSRLTDELISCAAADIKQTYLETRARYGELDRIRFEGPSIAKQGSFTTCDDRDNIFMGAVRAWENEVLFRSWEYQAHKLCALGNIAGSIGLISSLSRVDGLVLMQGGLNVSGFGVVINSVRELEKIYVAHDESASIPLTPVYTKKFGTRHRSMFNYCAQFANAIGFIVSQDGDVRTVTTVGKRVVLWENIRLYAGTDGGIRVVFRYEI